MQKTANQLLLKSYRAIERALDTAAMNWVARRPQGELPKAAQAGPNVPAEAGEATANTPLSAMSSLVTACSWGAGPTPTG
jgi:hypothetical protein